MYVYMYQDLLLLLNKKNLALTDKRNKTEENKTHHSTLHIKGTLKHQCYIFFFLFLISIFFFSSGGQQQQKKIKRFFVFVLFFTDLVGGFL